MRILINMPSQFGGHQSGVARVAFSLLARLLEQTPHHYILRSPWTQSQLPESLRNIRLDVMETPRPRFVFLDVLWQAVMMPLLCRRLGIDTVLNMDPFGSPTGGSRRLTIVHDLYFKTIPHQIGRRAALTSDFIFRLMIGGSNKLICVSEATRNDLCRFYPSAKAKSLTIHSDSTLSAIAVDLAEAPLVEGPYVLAVGNATPNKNFATLARAFAEIAPTQPALRIVHVGKDEAEVMLNVLPEALRGKVIRMSDISDQQIATLYRYAACLCIPSIYEGFCLPVLEAQEFGCPVLCADISATPEIAGDGALRFNPTDIGSLASALHRLFDEAGLADDLTQKGYKNRKKFSWDKAATAYAALFHQE